MSTNTALDDIKARVEGHSATPWQVKPYLFSDDRRVRVTSPDDGPDYNTAEGVLPADAELIAAAPKLLAALNRVEALAIAAENPHAYGAGVALMSKALRAAIQEALS